MSYQTIGALMLLGLVVSGFVLMSKVMESPAEAAKVFVISFGLSAFVVLACFFLTGGKP